MKTTTLTTTMARTDVLIRQISLVVQGTTGSTSFRNVIEQGVKNQWIRIVTVIGVTREGKIRQQIEIEIDWAEHALRLREANNGQITVSLATDEGNWISSVIGQIVEGFKEIKEQGELEAAWSVTYTPEAQAQSSEINRRLGLETAESRQWEDGHVDEIINKYRPKKLGEAAFSWKVVTKS